MKKLTIFKIEPPPSSFDKLRMKGLWQWMMVYHSLTLSLSKGEGRAQLGGQPVTIG